MELQTDAWDVWTTCFTLHDIVLPSTYYLGFTSHTGEVHDNHDIISITTNIIPKSEDYVIHVSFFFLFVVRCRHFSFF